MTPFSPRLSCSVVQLIVAAQQLDSKPLLIVTGDDFLKLASRNEGRLADHVWLILPPPEAVQTVVNKNRLQQFAREHEIDLPSGWTPATAEELEAVSVAIRFPTTC